VEYYEMMDQIREKYARPTTESGLGKVLMDPFGIGTQAEAEKSPKKANGQEKADSTTIATASVGVETPKK
jgi:hypothetical protein